MVVSDGSRCFRAEILSDPVLRNHIWPDIGSLRADEVPRAILSSSSHRNAQSEADLLLPCNGPSFNRGNLNLLA